MPGSKLETIAHIVALVMRFGGGLPYAVVVFAAAICIAAWMTWVPPVPNLSREEMNVKGFACGGEFKDKRLAREDVDRMMAAYVQAEPKPPPWANWKPPLTAEQKRYIMRMTIQALESLKKPQEVPDKPNLCGARLTNIDLAGLNLSSWNLAGAILEDANLRGTQLTQANLTGTQIIGASDCTDADFSRTEARRLYMSGADCAGASFVLADLSDARFIAGNVDKADFRGAVLERASLEGVGVNGAQFFAAKAVGMIYSPQLGSMPDLRSLDSVIGLHQIRAKADSRMIGMQAARREDQLVMTETPMSTLGSTAPLRELQSALAKAGTDASARAVNYSLRVAERRSDPLAERAFQYAAYELPSAYGYRPERSLLTVLLLIPLISPLYWAAIVGEKTEHDRAGLWIRRSERMDVNRTPKSIRLHARNSKPCAWGVALYVSLLSAFRIGWHDFNVGDWIARLQRSDYKIEAIGWPRTIIGLQSLLSIYLLVRFLVEYLSL